MKSRFAVLGPVALPWASCFFFFFFLLLFFFFSPSPFSCSLSFKKQKQKNNTSPVLIKPSAQLRDLIKILGVSVPLSHHCAVFAALTFDVITVGRDVFA